MQGEGEKLRVDMELGGDKRRGRRRGNAVPWRRATQEGKKEGVGTSKISPEEITAIFICNETDGVGSTKEREGPLGLQKVQK